VKPKKPAPSQYNKKPVTNSIQNFARPGTMLKTKSNPLVNTVSVRDGGLTFKTYPSRVTSGSSTAFKENPVYTGTEVKGISLVHKSGFMPVFTDEQAVDFANMRR
jgi:hypothetical protein